MIEVSFLYVLRIVHEYCLDGVHINPIQVKMETFLCTENPYNWTVKEDTFKCSW